MKRRCSMDFEIEAEMKRLEQQGVPPWQAMEDAVRNVRRRWDEKSIPVESDEVLAVAGRVMQ